MSPHARVCHRHKRLIYDGERCPECYQERVADNARRNIELGRNSQHWRKVSRAARFNAGGICPDCGISEDPADPGSKLTADVPAGGDHSKVRLRDVVVRCRRCHGRATGGRRL